MEDRDEIFRQIQELVHEYRFDCPQSVSSDYYPMTDAQALRTLERIQRYGTVEEFKRAGKLRNWLLLNGEPKGSMSERDEIFQQIRALMDEYRSQCLWYMRRDFYPETERQAMMTLDCIQQYGTVDAFKRAGKLKAWLLQNSNAATELRFHDVHAMMAAEN